MSDNPKINQIYILYKTIKAMNTSLLFFSTLFTQGCVSKYIIQGNITNDDSLCLAYV
jgi:hypothetical protein